MTLHQRLSDATEGTWGGSSLSAHYGDPCVYCKAAHDDVTPGPCPSRAHVRAGERTLFRMTQADYAGIIDAIQKARSTPLIAINCGMPTSPQEAANNAWKALGRRLGFDGMSVRPSDELLSFTAKATASPDTGVGG